jgi:hypothetical protein
MRNNQNSHNKINIFLNYFFTLTNGCGTHKILDSANPENLKVAEKLAEQVICLPIYPN